MEVRYVVVPGGAGAIGMEVASVFPGDQYRVLITSRSKQRADEHAAKLREQGVRAQGAELDVLSDESVVAFVRHVEGLFGRVTTLIDCAGGNFAAAKLIPDSDKLSPEFRSAVRTVFELNLVWPGLMVPAFEHLLLREIHGASVILLDSVSSVRPLGKVEYYSAAKAGVTNLTQGFARYFARSLGRPDIRVNAVRPGFFPAEQNRALLFENGDPLKPTPRGAQIVGMTLANRLGSLHELKGAFRFLADPEQSGFVTGQVLSVDGGFTAFSGVDK